MPDREAVAAATRRPRSPYRKGARYEYHVRDLLREDGYLVARTAGSRGPFDLIAIHPEKREILLIQVKKAGSAPRTLREELARLAGTYTVRPVLFVRGRWEELRQA